MRNSPTVLSLSMDEQSRLVKQWFNHSVPLNGTQGSYICQELEKGELPWEHAQALGLENHHDFCPRIVALKSLGGFYHNPALWWWLRRGCAMVTAVSASLHFLVMTLAHILHSVRGTLPSSSSLLLRNTEETRSDTWKCYRAVTSPGYKMVLVEAENSAAWSTFALSSWCPTVCKAASRQHCFVIHLTLRALVRGNWICDMVRCLFLDSVVPCLTGHICQGKWQYI